MMKLNIAVIAFLTFLTCAMADDGSLVGLSNRLDSARSYLSTNDPVAICNTNVPIRIHTPAAHPEMLIGFPLKIQQPIVMSNGWTEIGIVFDFAPIGTFQVTRYPNEEGYRLLVSIDKDGRFEGSRMIREYKELKVPNRLPVTD